MTNNETDPFAGGESVPSLSFKDDPIGTVKTLIVTEPAKLLQSRDFDTDELAFWPGKNGQPGNPKMAAVINGTVDGEERSVWAIKPSAMFSAIKDAQNAVSAGYRLKAGDTLAIKYVKDERPKNPKHNPRKIYAAKITPAPEPQAADAFGDEPPF